MISFPVRTLKKMMNGAMGPLLSFVALFALPLLGAVTLTPSEFAFWALLASISTVALSLDFGGVALLNARYHFAPRLRVHLQACALSASGAIVVGGVALVVWIPISGQSFGGVASYASGALAIGLMALAALERSALMVIAQAALLENWLALRNVAMAGQAALAVAVAAALLVVAPSFWALPVGWLVSGTLMLPVCAVWFAVKARRVRHEVRGTHDINWLQFAGLRTLNTIVASTVMQADRWIIALLAGPHWLAVYEVAWRFASLPRILLQALALHVSVEVAPLARGQGDVMMRSVWHSTRIAAVIGFFSSIVVAGAYLVFLSWTEQQGDVMLLIVMLVAFLALALTSPLSIAGMTAGRAGIDLPYALVALAGMALFAAIGAAEGVSVFAYGYLASLIVSVPIFFWYAPKSAVSALDLRVANNAAQQRSN